MPTADSTSVLSSVLSAAGWETILVATVAALAAALVVRRTPWGLLTGFLRIVAGVLAFAAVVSYFAAAAEREREAQVEALAARQATLTASVVASGSPLACLDDMSGEAVGDACEKAIFARPETVAAAVAYADARLRLVADMSRLATADDRDLTSRLAALRRSIALDRYGIVAHVLAERDGCTAETCDAFAWIGDPTVLRTNLRGRVFNTYVGRYASFWGGAKPAEAPDNVPQAEASPAEPAKPATNFAGRYDFPSAASIPPVSIMNPEPPRPPAGAAAASAAPPTTAQAEPLQKAPMPPRRPAARPIPIAPPAASTGGAAAPQQPVTAAPDRR